MIGFDDAPFAKEKKGPVGIVGVVCSNTRFEGMLYGHVSKDGFDATDVIIRMLKNSKFLAQLNLILLDGIAVGGFNIIDLEKLYHAFGLPCVAVMRKTPDFASIENALQHFADGNQRLQTIQSAGTVYQAGAFIFQVKGADHERIAHVLARLTDTGKVPEALRLAHLIGAAFIKGESGRRA